MENNINISSPFYSINNMSSSYYNYDYNSNSSNSNSNNNNGLLCMEDYRRDNLGGTEIGSSSDGIMKERKKEGKDKKVKKHRFAFHTRSQVDILDDGYRWRKYGQKAVKNNKFPRSYYRCTQVGCNVKKQVQRLSNDEEVVVTTYEGVHTHSVERSTDNFEHILKQMQIYVPP